MHNIQYIANDSYVPFACRLLLPASTTVSGLVDYNNAFLYLTLSCSIYKQAEDFYACVIYNTKI